MIRSLPAARLRGQSLPCLLCQWRVFSTSHPRLDEKPAATPPRTGEPLDAQRRSGPLADAPRSYGKRTEKFAPKPLARPIGMPDPPKPGENTGGDHRSLAHPRDYFCNYGKNLERRA